MKKILFTILCSSTFLIACAKPNAPAVSTITTEKASTMNTQQITHPTAKSAFESWQNNDSKAWLALFTAKPALFDDGKPRDFHQFSEQIGKEKFTSIDRVENDGTGIIGDFETPWGKFKTYFRFTIGADGKISRLDIGQAN